MWVFLAMFDFFDSMLDVGLHMWVLDPLLAKSLNPLATTLTKREDSRHRLVPVPVPAN